MMMMMGGEKNKVIGCRTERVRRHRDGPHSPTCTLGVLGGHGMYMYYFIYLHYLLYYTLGGTCTQLVYYICTCTIWKQVVR